MPLQITRLTADDWRRYREVRLMALADAPYAFGTTLASALALDEAGWRERAGGPATLVASVAGHDVGLLALWLHPDHFPRGLVTQMWVDPAARGAGVASALVAALVDRARELGVGELHLHVTDGNERAAGLYRGLGWVAVGEPEPVDADDPGRGTQQRMVRAI